MHIFVSFVFGLCEQLLRPKCKVHGCLCHYCAWLPVYTRGVRKMTLKVMYIITSDCVVFEFCMKYHVTNVQGSMPKLLTLNRVLQGADGTTVNIYRIISLLLSALFASHLMQSRMSLS